jgi:hypothetical protein
MTPISALLTAAASILLVNSAFAADALKQQVDVWRGSHETEILTTFDRLLRFPSVAADPDGTGAAGA